MKLLALSIVCVSGGVALAQPAPPPPPPPGGTYPPPAGPTAGPGQPQPPPPPQGGGYGAPQGGGYGAPQGGYPPPQGGYPPPQGGYPPPQGGYPPPQGYGTAQPGMYGAPPPSTAHEGFTFEANLGIGVLRVAQGDMSDSRTALGGLSLGVGGWVSPRLAVSARIAGVTYFNSDTNPTTQLTHAFFGPSAQYWIDDHLWFGGGLGLSIAQASAGNQTNDEKGFGLDLRAGYTFTAGSNHSFNASVEVNPGWYSEKNASGQDQTVSVQGLAFLLGYQYL